MNKNLNSTKMNDGTITLDIFMQHAKEFLKISKKIGDTWLLINLDNDNEKTFLKFEQKLIIPQFENSKNLCNETIDPCVISMNNAKNQVIHFEYHVVYSINYQVPVLYIKGYHNDGSIVSLEESWKIFEKSLTKNGLKTLDYHKFLTQMEHPILFKPYFAIHPCQTASFLSNFNKSKNIIVTFLSTLGPFVRLNINILYDIHLS